MLEEISISNNILEEIISEIESCAFLLWQRYHFLYLKWGGGDADKFNIEMKIFSNQISIF